MTRALALALLLAVPAPVSTDAFARLWEEFCAYFLPVDARSASMGSTPRDADVVPATEGRDTAGAGAPPTGVVGDSPHEGQSEACGVDPRWDGSRHALAVAERVGASGRHSPAVAPALDLGASTPRQARPRGDRRATQQERAA